MKNKIIEWAKARDFHATTAVAQMYKLREEYGELNASVVRNNIDGIKDAIGDMLVVLIIQNWLMGQEDEFEIETFRMKHVGKVCLDYIFCNLDYYISRLSKCITDHNHDRFSSSYAIIVELEYICEKYNTTLDECLKLAYEQIKDRRGKMIGGVWVKQEDFVKKEDL